MADQTFGHQDELPSLPVPALEDTMDKLLKSSEPFLNETELEHTAAVIEDFKAGVGARLQAMLEDKGKDERNWLEEWWEMFAYLQPRYPSAININWHGVMPITMSTAARPVSQAECAALLARHVCLFRKSLLEGTLPAETMAGQKLCMYQYARMFNSCRVAHEGMDEIAEYDPHPRHIVVLRNNAIYTFDLIQEDNSPLPYPDILAQFQRILTAGTSLLGTDRDPPVSVLTSENRDTWAKARTHLVELDPTNAASLRTVESAAFVMTLASEGYDSLEELAKASLHGDGRNKWFDKPFNMIVYENARTGTNGEHSWADAMVAVKMFYEIMKTISAELAETGFPAPGKASAGLPEPRKLEWVLDTTAVAAIEYASANLSTLIRTVDLRVLEFSHYGKAFIKRFRLVPDFYVQLAIQLAYYRLFHTVTAVYESGHTRLFYHGRTDTIRSQTVDSVAFVKTMCDAAASDTERFEKLKAAIATHLEFTRDVLMGKGVDRHLMGLYILSEMSGIKPTPALFTDKGFLCSKDYKLSTSNISLGDSPIFGGFMPITTDGVGVCYGIQSDNIKFSIATNNDCPTTSAATFRVALEQALIDMQRLCLTRNVIYVGGSGAGAGAGASKM